MGQLRHDRHVLDGLRALVKTPVEPSSRAYQSDVVTYRCEGGSALQAAYLNIEGGESFATLNYKDKLVPMHTSSAASGVLYVADDEQNSYRWHIKGGYGGGSVVS